MGGFFGIICGLIYNDCMSISLTLFGSSGYDQTTGQWTGVYPFGVDPVWHGRKNQLMFLNSYKMKQAVLLGVAQMLFGLMIKLFNHIEEGDRISLIWEFIPQLLFLLSFFGYMCFMIIYK